MRFAPPRRPRQPRENIVPMINVVFLLLIFFLMTAQIAPPDPFDITPPNSTSPVAAESPDVLYIAADGTLAFGALRDDAVFGALAQRLGTQPLLIRADAALKAGDLARLLPRLASAGVDEVALITGAAP
jgi:biopolymer transport protein ExbD